MSTRTRAVAALALLVVAVGVLPAAADERRAPRPVIDLYTPGGGASTVDADQVVHVAGVFEGKPYGGPYTASFRADDGSLPAPGACEPATATLELDGPRRTFLSLSATGDVCGQYGSGGSPPWHKFTGRYLVEDARPTRLEGTDGFLELIATPAGFGNGFAIDT